MSDTAPSIPLETRTLKVPPHSTEAEQSVLGALMLNNEAWFDVSDIVAPVDFYRPQHRIVFEAMAALSRDNQPLDAVTVSEALQSLGLLEKAGGIAYLAELVDGTPGASNVTAYARIVRDRSTLRQVIAAANKIVEKAFMREGQSDEEILDYAEEEIFRISEERAKSDGPQDINPLLERTVRRVNELSKSEGGITGLATGFSDLDNLTAGLQKADLVIVAGRPSMGKTSLAMNMVEHAIMKSEAPSLVFSLEMPADQLVMRMLSSLARIDQSRMRIGDLDEKDWDRFSAAVQQLQDKPLHIDDSAALTPNEIRARARRVARQYKGLGLIVVDYMQLMRGSGQAENRTTEISEISRSLKALAKEMRCPVVAAAQLNRALETRNNKRPIMADLRESGAIEQDADVILFIYRDEVYNEETEDVGIAEIIIGKQRNGPIGTVKLSYLNQLTRFEDLARDRYGDLSPGYDG
ncbi:MAG: replicative DNA helicase [Gammaproteobacteria bacterium]|nr:replicative DNA helicase [Gammaproteobacteria bacterium]MDE0366957.1 replicative DNA helicase [Gammaproteobacteria bacterium]